MMVQRHRRRASTARMAAYTALERVIRENQPLGESLGQELAAANLSENDAALCTELVYGVERMRLKLDHYLAQVSRRAIPSLDLAVTIVLRIGAYQLLFLDRVPAFAAVDESVQLVRYVGQKSAAGFVNGVLRTLDRQKAHLALPSMEADPVEYMAVHYSHPRWMLRKLLPSLGLEETAAFCAWNNQPSLTELRVNTLQQSTAALQERLEREGWTASPGHYAPDVLTLASGRGLFDSPMFFSGCFYAQSEASTLVGHALAAKPGQVIYDLCSAPGGKATHLAALMKNQGRIVAVDRDQNRLSKVAQNARRLGASILSLRCADAAELSLPPADGVLVDAPCSGLGVLRHRPDIRWKRNAEACASLAVQQQRLLQNAAHMVKPGGRLVYATCTVLEEENRAITTAFLRQNPEFAYGLLPAFYPEVAQGDIQFWPQRHALDGFYISCLQKYG